MNMRTCNNEKMNILDLPDTVLMDIFELLTYDEVARKREVCARFNYICQTVLNTGFNKVVQEHAKNFKRIKSLLPRRESERRNHILARHSDILTSIETRISMLTMTYSKFIDLNICCFIPGRVLDEISSILRLLASTTKPLRPHEVLQELRDISSMAIEHFDEKIAINFKAAIKLNNDPSTSNASSSVSASVVVGGTLGEIGFNGISRKTGHALTQCHAAMMQQALLLTKTVPGPVPIPTHANPDRLMKQLQKYSHSQTKMSIKLRFLESSLKTQNRRLQEAIGTITELSTQVSELKRQLESSTAASAAPKGVKTRSKAVPHDQPPSKKRRS